MKPVQIIAAAPGWCIKRDVTERYMLQVACWALCDDGLVRPVVSADSGLIVEEEPCTVYEPHQAFAYKWTDGNTPDDSDWEPVLNDAEHTLWRQPHRP